MKPIINGTGNYYLEAQTRDAGRTDVVVDYRGEQFVVEMKIWRGNEYNERGESQCEFSYKSRVMATKEPLITLKAPYMERNPMKWGFFRLKSG